jgi:hypothetical protein
MFLRIRIRVFVTLICGLIAGGNGTMPAESASALIFPEHFEAIEKLMSSN